MNKPILFNTEMVRAIMEGRKTVTRRIAKFPAEVFSLVKVLYYEKDGAWFSTNNFTQFFVFAPYKVDDILYVRETWYYEEHMHEITAGKPDLPYGLYSHRFVFKASNPDYPVDIGVGKNGWSPSIHMPKTAARIFLRVIDVRAERLQEISNKDALREGVARHGLYNEECYAGGCYNGDFESSCAECEVPRKGFSKLWYSTIKPADLDRYGWSASPWVWVIEFERAEKPEDFV